MNQYNSSKEGINVNYVSFTIEATSQIGTIGTIIFEIIERARILDNQSISHR